LLSVWRLFDTTGGALAFHGIGRNLKDAFYQLQPTPMPIPTLHVVEAIAPHAMSGYFEVYLVKLLLQYIGS